MAVGDVNGDGKVDVVTGNYYASTASVLLGNGDGTFTAKDDYTTGSGTNPESLRMGDVNGDGYLDIFTANAATNNVSILINNGNGTFRAPAAFSTAAHPTFVDLSDLNGDGKQDLVTANYTAGSVSVLMGNGNGTFQTAVNYAASGNPQMVLAADLNRDGKLDLSTVNWTTNNASVLINNGNGTFKTAVNYPLGDGPFALSIIDLNQDSALDLVATNHTAGSVSILYGNGDGTFDAKTDLACGRSPYFVALGDLNGDGYGDLITTDMDDNTVSVFRGTAFLGASYSGKADGIWFFHVRAVNSSGVGGPTTTRELRVDCTAPATSDSSTPALAADGDSSWRQTGQTVTLAAADVSSGLAHTYYTLDGVQHDYDRTLRREWRRQPRDHVLVHRRRRQHRGGASWLGEHRRRRAKQQRRVDPGPGARLAERLAQDRAVRDALRRGRGRGSCQRRGPYRVRPGRRGLRAVRGTVPGRHAGVAHAELPRRRSRRQR